jgi:hypothetical protein
VIAGRYGKGVDFFVFEQLAEVGVSFGLGSLDVFGEGNGALGYSLIDVADGCYAGAGQRGVGVHMAASAAAYTDYGHIDPIVGA